MDEIDFIDRLELPASLYDKIEGNVTDLLSFLNIQSYPIDPKEIAKRLGYELKTFEYMSKAAKKMVDMNEGDGISYYDPDLCKYIIYYRDNGMEERVRFTLCHEIGHIRMGHRCESTLARYIANYYAAYLLAPSPWIGHAGCMDFTDVAKKFYVSKDCALHCFKRYERWSDIQTDKEYEKTLINLLSSAKDSGVF